MITTITFVSMTIGLMGLSISQLSLYAQLREIRRRLESIENDMPDVPLGRQR